MSSLEHTIEEVMTEAAAPVAKGSSSGPDKDAEKKSAASVDKAADAVKKAKAPGGDKASEKGEEPKDGVNKVEKGKAVNMEDVEDGEGFEIVINPSCNVTDAKRCSLDFTPSN